MNNFGFVVRTKDYGQGQINQFGFVGNKEKKTLIKEKKTNLALLVKMTKENC